MVNRAVSIVVAALMIVVMAQPAALFAEQGATDQQSESKQPVEVEWLRGFDDTLKLRLRGEVLAADGSPAANFTLKAAIHFGVMAKAIDVKVDGHRFECRVPLSGGNLHRVGIVATENDGNHAAFESVVSYELRESAKSGVKLALAPPSRVVRVKVMDADKPVAGAHVSASVSGELEPKAITNSEGIADIKFYQGSELYTLTAWADDYRIGGTSFYSTNRRDPEATEYTIELDKCRDQLIRFVDEHGKPVAGGKFEIDVRKGPEVYDYLGSCEHSNVTTNDAGEVLYKWAPDWKDRYIFAGCLTNDQAVDQDREVIENVLVLKTMKYRKSERKRISGRVTATGYDVGGICVELLTFQSELESNVDLVTVYTNPDGTFVADVLPDSTYLSYVVDETLVGPAVPLILFDSKTGLAQSPQLSVTEGTPVEVIVMTGPEKKPWANVLVYAKREEDFTWMEDGKEQRGSSGPSLYVKTDESGRVVVRAHPGELILKIRSPLWDEEQNVRITQGEQTKVLFHRRVDQRMTKTCRLVLPPGIESSLADAEVRMVQEYPGYQDPDNSEKQRTMKCAADGLFSFTTALPEVVIYAATSDRRAAGSFVVDTVRSPAELPLKPTVEYRGQLLTVGQQPLANHRVWATVSIRARRVPNERVPDPMEVQRVETTTDEQGNYNLKGLPLLTDVNIYAAGLQSGEENFYLANLYLEKGKPGKPAVSEVPFTAEEPPSKRPLAERIQRVVGNCTLFHYRPLLLIGKEQPTIREFATKHLLNDNENPDAYRFMSLLFFQPEEGYSAEDLAFCAKQGWELPPDGSLSAYAFDIDGKLMERLDFDITSPAAASAAADFLRRNTLPSENPQDKWNAAFAEARKTNRRVWVRMGGKYCNPCHRLARWILAHREVLEKDYVFLEFDDSREDYDEYRRRLGYESGGIPFYGMFSPDEQLLINSDGRRGNIGFPDDGHSKYEFKQMLLKSRKNLTDTEIDELVESIK